MSCRSAASISSRQTWDMLLPDWPQWTRSSPRNRLSERCHKSSWLVRPSQSSVRCYEMHSRGQIKKKRLFILQPVLDLHPVFLHFVIFVDLLVILSYKKGKGPQSKPAPPRVSSDFSKQKTEMSAAGCKKVLNLLCRTAVVFQQETLT